MRPEDRERYSRMHTAVIDDIERRTELLKEEVKERKGQIAKLRKEERRLRDLLTGRTAEEPEFPEVERVLAEARKGRSDA